MLYVAYEFEGTDASGDFKGRSGKVFNLEIPRTIADLQALHDEIVKQETGIHKCLIHTVVMTFWTPIRG